MIPRDALTGQVVVSAIEPRRAAILCWLLDHDSMLRWYDEDEPGYVLRARPVPQRLSQKGCFAVVKALKEAGFYSAGTASQAILARERVREARLVASQGLRARTQLRRLAAGYKPPHARP